MHGTSIAYKRARMHGTSIVHKRARMHGTSIAYKRPSAQGSQCMHHTHVVVRVLAAAVVEHRVVWCTIAARLRRVVDVLSSAADMPLYGCKHLRSH